MTRARRSLPTKRPSDSRAQGDPELALRAAANAPRDAVDAGQVDGLRFWYDAFACAPTELRQTLLRDAGLEALPATP